MTEPAASGFGHSTRNDVDFLPEEERTTVEHQSDIALIISAPYEFEKLFPPDALDTYIWLHVPSAYSAVKMTCTGICFPSVWLLPYSSAALRGSGFARFAQLLDNPRYQARTYTRMAECGVLPLSDPSKIKRYHLELGPSDDSELHAEHLEALTLPRGIIRYSAMTNNGSASVPLSCAGGHDDACQCFKLGLAMKKSHENTEEGGQGAAAEPRSDEATSPEPDDEDGQTNTPAPEPHDSEATAGTQPQGSEDHIRVATRPRPGPSDDSRVKSVWDLELAPELQIEDYCEIRHISNVIRLLTVIAGHRLVLNSAARVYTLAGLAKLFALTSSDGYYDGDLEMYVDRVSVANSFRSTIAAWFFNKNNAAIVDVLPEECFIIAWNLKMAPVLRAAFRILVAERALSETAKNSDGPRKPQARRMTAFGRELSGLLDDDMQTIVEHSSNDLIQRLLAFRDKLEAHMLALRNHCTAYQRVGDGAAGSASYNIAKDSLFAGAQDGVLAKLLKVSELLETCSAAEQTILSTSPQLPSLQSNVLSAFEAVQTLLYHIATMVVKAYYGPLCKPKQSYAPVQTGAIKRCISLYRRNKPKNADDGDDDEWLSTAYKQLCDDQKCMTALYWKALAMGTLSGLRTQAQENEYNNLLRTVDAKILAAVTPDAESANGTVITDYTTERALANLRRDLLFRLQDIGLLPEVVAGHTTELFALSSVVDALHTLVGTPLYPFYERTYYSPMIELSMLKPSPHLMLGLTADEFRYLPLWAGGFNDDTGAVFQTVLPSAQLGPAGPGPAYHTGHTAASKADTASAAALSMAGPPSVSSDGVGGFVNLRLSDTGTQRAASATTRSTDFVVSQGLEQDPAVFGLANREGASIADSPASGPQAHGGVSSVAGERSANTSSIRSLPTPSETASSFVIVGDTAPATPAQANTAPTDTAVATTLNHEGDEDDMFDFGDDDFDDDEYDDVDDDDNMQQFIDDDSSDARSDDTLMPDRDEIMEAMRRDGAQA